LWRIVQWRNHQSCLFWCIISRSSIGSSPKQQSQPILIAEEDLAYTPSTSLLVSPFLGEPVSDSVHDLFDKGVHLLRGRVLLCSKLEHAGYTAREKNWVYTVMIEYEDTIQIFENILSANVMCQKTWLYNSSVSFHLEWLKMKISNELWVWTELTIPWNNTSCHK
jgi:hypothetical protein